jgi:hypothetical protein
VHAPFQVLLIIISSLLFLGFKEVNSLGQDAPGDLQRAPRTRGCFFLCFYTLRLKGRRFHDFVYTRERTPNHAH